MDYDTDKLRLNASSWFPGIGYLAGNKYWDNIPNSGILQSDNLPKQAKGMFTYVPTDQAYSASNIHMKLPAWGSNFGSKEEREAWVGRDITSDFGLFRCVQLNSDISSYAYLNENALLNSKGQLVENDPDLSPKLHFNINDIHQATQDYQTSWVFAYINGYNSYTGKHNLVVKINNIFFTSYEVDLDTCVFQHWTKPDIRRLRTKHPEYFDPHKMPVLLTSIADLEYVYGVNHPNWLTCEELNSCSDWEPVGRALLAKKHANQTSCKYSSDSSE